MQRTHREQHSPTLAASAAPPTRAPTPPQCWHASRVVDSQQPPLASTLAPRFAQPPWHPNPSHPIWSEPRPTSTRRAPPTDPHHLHKIHSLPCKRPQWPSPATVQHTLHSRVCHPLTACIALRLAYTHKIYLYFSTHRSLSARCDLSRVTYIPPRACAATCIASNAPRGPHVAALGPHAGLCDHACRRKSTNMPALSEPLSSTTSVPPPHHHACTALWPRV